MNIQKGWITRFGEWIDTRRADQANHDVAIKRIIRILRWLTPNGGTILLALVLISTQHVWAERLQETTALIGASATTINYQGRLADSSGNPITQSGVAMSFTIFDDPDWGNAIWGPEMHSVDVSNGLFSVGLGSMTAGGIPTNVWNGDRYLEIRVGGEPLVPRELIRSVPVAGMALSVPNGAIGSAQIADGEITPSKLNLDYGTACLSSNTLISLPGSYQSAYVPELNLDISLPNPSVVLIWMDGLAMYDQPIFGEVAVNLVIDDTPSTASFGWQDDVWWNVEGQRLVNLSSGAHTLRIRVGAQNAGTLTLHGWGSYRTCINYLVLGSQ